MLTLTDGSQCFGIFNPIDFRYDCKLHDCVKTNAKEISIRKVLGADPIHILVIVTSDLLVIIAVSFLVSAPIAYYTMNEWLSQFTFRTTLDAISFAIAFCSCIAISALTVIFRIAKVTRLNPVNYLKLD